MGLDSPFQKSPIMTPKTWTSQLGDAFEDTAFKPGFGILKCYLMNCSSSLLREIDTTKCWWHQQLSAITVFWYVLFQLLIPWLTPISLLESELEFWHLSRNSQTPENGHLHIHCLCWLITRARLAGWVNLNQHIRRSKCPILSGKT
jgi:hypothetical protein